LVLASAVAHVTAAVSAVEEEVEQRTQEHQQKRQRAQDMRCVLGDEEECGNGEESQQHEAGA
jgi:hypothetical protein